MTKRDRLEALIAHRVRLTKRLLADARAQEDLLKTIRKETSSGCETLFDVLYKAIRELMDKVEPPERQPVWWEGP